MALFKQFDRQKLKQQAGIALSALILLAAPQASAQKQDFPPLPELQPFNMTAFYSVSWSGIGVGGLVINAHEDDQKYNLEATVKASGIAYALTKHMSTNTVQGIKKEGKYIPQEFETVFKLRKKTRHIILNYDENGNLIKEHNTPPENRKKRPEVPMDLKKNVLDVMSILFYQRGEIYRALKFNKPDFSYRMYDGRRLTDITVHVKGRKTVWWKGNQTPVIIFNVSRSPVAGFKKSELEDLAKDKDPDIDFYFSDDGRLIPLKIVVDADAGSFYANYESSCDTVSACIKKLD